METATKRIVTNSDLDSIASCVLLRRVEPVGEIKFIDLDLIRKGWRAEPTDIAVNVPYVEGCGLWFDHHDSNAVDHPYAGRHERAPSAARVIYNHYAAAGRANEFAAFEELLRETDKVDSAMFTREDILNPRRYVLISHLISSQPVEDGTVDENLQLIRLFEEGPAEHALAHPVFAGQAAEFLDRLESSKAAIRKYIRREGNLLIMDLRRVPEPERELANNKFLPYVLFEGGDTDVSRPGTQAAGTPLAQSGGADILIRVKPHTDTRSFITVGFNIFSPDTRLRGHIGNFLKQFLGGGHPKAGGCSVHPDRADEVLQKTIDAFVIR